MNNIQLSILLQSYYSLLEIAIETTRDELPSEAFREEEIKPFMSLPYKAQIADCLNPLYTILNRITDDIKLLSETSVDSRK